MTGNVNRFWPSIKEAGKFNYEPEYTEIQNRNCRQEAQGQEETSQNTSFHYSTLSLCGSLKYLSHSTIGELSPQMDPKTLDYDVPIPCKPFSMSL